MYHCLLTPGVESGTGHLDSNVLLAAWSDTRD